MLGGCCRTARDATTASIQGVSQQSEMPTHLKTHARILVSSSQMWIFTPASIYISGPYRSACPMRPQMAAINGNHRPAMCRAERSRVWCNYANCFSSFFFFFWFVFSLFGVFVYMFARSGSCRAWIILSALNQFPADVLGHMNGETTRHALTHTQACCDWDASTVQNQYTRRKIRVQLFKISDFILNRWDVRFVHDVDRS